MISQETIVALASPSGAGAIAVIRLSGKDALAIAEQVFQSVSGKSISKQKTHTIHLGHIVDDGKVFDQILLSIFKNPHSYTGEDSIEFSCHGGFVTTNGVLQVLLDSGARLAEPGEFTKRAFLGGKIDLSQAEAVADIIAARTNRAQQVSLCQLHSLNGNAR